MAVSALWGSLTALKPMFKLIGARLGALVAGECEAAKPSPPEPKTNSSVRPGANHQAELQAGRLPKIVRCQAVLMLFGPARFATRPKNPAQLARPRAHPRRAGG